MIDSRVIARLTSLASEAASPHVRRIAPLISVVGEALNRLPLERVAERTRYLAFNVNGKRYRASYRHPARSPRQRGEIIIRHMTNRSGHVVVAIGTMPQAIAFYNNPRLGVRFREGNRR